MCQYLCFSIEFFYEDFHGQCSDGKPEWPPSPLRFFQALVATAAEHGSGKFANNVQEALKWLENQNPPIILTPIDSPGTTYNISIPNNNMNKSGEKHQRSMKPVSPINMINGNTIYYIWYLDDIIPDEVKDYIEVLINIVLELNYLGRAIDQVVGGGSIITCEQYNILPGIKWFTNYNAIGNFLDIPINGTFNNLIDRFEQQKSPPRSLPKLLTCFNTIRYRREIDLPTREISTFSILNENNKLQSFNIEDSICVVGMVKHAIKRKAEEKGKLESWTNSFVLGHSEPFNSKHKPVGLKRYVYQMIPDIYVKDGKTYVGRFSRFILSSDENCESEIKWAKECLIGQELIEENSQQLIGYISSLREDKIVQYYVRRSSLWTTVTPYVVPDIKYEEIMKYVKSTEEHMKIKLDELFRKKIRKSIRQSGLFPIKLIKYIKIEWNRSGFLQGTIHANKYKYMVPDHMRERIFLHVKLQFCDEYSRPLNIPGPICIGGGRYYSLGLFVAL